MSNTVKSSVKIASGAVVCNECELKGEVTIGENNIIEEQAEIINRVDTETDGSTVPVMIIGNNNVLEVGATCYSLKIGDNNVLETKSYVGRRTNLSNGCIIGAGCRMSREEVLKENTVVYGGHCDRRVASDRPAPQTLQIDFLSKVLPNYHHLKKPAKKPAA